jgi:hypothetical protein
MRFEAESNVTRTRYVTSYLLRRLFFDDVARDQYARGSALQRILNAGAQVQEREIVQTNAGNRFNELS